MNYAATFFEFLSQHFEKTCKLPKIITYVSYRMKRWENKILPVYCRIKMISSHFAYIQAQQIIFLTNFQAEPMSQRVMADQVVRNQLQPPLEIYTNSLKWMITKKKYSHNSHHPLKSFNLSTYLIYMDFAVKIFKTLENTIPEWLRRSVQIKDNILQASPKHGHPPDMLPSQAVDH